MPDVPDLTSLTAMLIIGPAIVVPQIRLRSWKKTYILRCALILMAVVIWIIAVIPQLKTYPPTDDYIVYVTNTGEKYHTADCSHLRKSKIPMVMADAIAEGYNDCSHCDPPEYRTEEIRITLSDLYAPIACTDVLLIIAAIAILAGIYALFYFIDKRTRPKK